MKSKVFEIPARPSRKTLLTDLAYREMYKRSIEHPESFWAEMATEFLDWYRHWDTVLEWDYYKAQIKWFLGAKINVCYNCVDRHLDKHAAKTALIWEGNEPGEVKRFSYSELHYQVCRMANVLKAKGIGKGDRVAIYMPMIPEALFAMLACARIGAVHSVIFGGFSAEAVRDRVSDAQCKMVITANEGVRGAKQIALKQAVDRGIEGLSFVQSVLVAKRTSTPVAMQAGRDFWLEEELSKVEDDCDPEIMDAEDPLFILYTSGSTGKPKGVLHTQAGYLLYAAVTHKYVFDYHDEDIYFCAADIGWVTGHSYIVYGPLANGATTLMFESLPNYPDAGRYWDMVERHKINIFYTAPTAIRAVAKEGENLPDKYDLSSLRVLGSVGEPINQDAWLWYFEKVGKAECSIVDTWWQTETGGIMISPLPGSTKLKPGSATRPFFGIKPCLVDESGAKLEGYDFAGRLCIEFPWPGQMRTVYGDHQRFFNTYFSHYPGKYFTGDACFRDVDGYYWITGRVDDVVNVAGHRLGTAEIENAVVRSGIVAEAAVVPMPHEIKGQAIYAFCIAKDGVAASEESKNLIRNSVRQIIGAFASPDIVQFVAGLPKTRSGKIMRRILRKIAEGERSEFGDISTLADPGVVEKIVQGRQ